MSTNPRVLRACQIFARYFGPPHFAYYPACGSDASPSEAFGTISVTYVDPIEQGVQEILRRFPDVIGLAVTAESYTHEISFDFVLSVHSHAPFGAEIKDLEVGGFLLIANKMSDRAFDHPNLELVAVITDEAGVGKEIMFTDLERFEEVDLDHDEISFSNRRKIKAPFYVFRKLA